MTLDEYVVWAAATGASRPAAVPEEHVLEEIGLGFATAIGEVAGILARWLRDGEWRRDRLADALADAACHWARVCAVTGMAPSALLARSRAHVDWRRAGRPPGGPAPVAASMTLEEFAVWVARGSGTGPGEQPDGASAGHVGLALAGDAGEVVDSLRQLAREGDRHRERLAGELGDVWRHWTRLCITAGLAPAELLERSRARVEARPEMGAGPGTP